MSRSRLRLSVGRLSRLAPGVASSVFVPSVELPAFAFPSSSGCHRSNFQLAPVVPPLALPKARRPACAFRLYPPVRPVSRRLPTRVGCLAPASCGWLSRLSSGAPSSGVVPFDRLPAQSFTNPLILLPVSFQLAPSSGFVCYFSDSFPTYCSFISWTDSTDQQPVHASANHVICVDCNGAFQASKRRG